ncbi:DUF1748-domain-containing protein [Pluteus cervinus]|uniref:DUF1748-domain-containing protein n=1 Tax=Pluteus cervinus TaxID=181527 RepID=A0ACD3AWW8_9AGAR|nr:DUF1748-domain-containing protein [Pluteus cervinus]
MVIGRLTHYALDVALLSTVLAGVRRTSGLTPDTTLISDSTTRSVAERFLGFGETVFDLIQGTAVNSAYFKRETK